jgi:hypothetical protein
MSSAYVFKDSGYVSVRLIVFLLIQGMSFARAGYDHINSSQCAISSATPPNCPQILVSIDSGCIFNIINVSVEMFMTETCSYCACEAS